MGASQNKYPTYPCVDADLQLVFLDPESEGIPLNKKNMDRAMELSTRKHSDVTFYSQDPEKLKMWRLRGGSLFDFILGR
jgi:hypothetical protein